MLPKKSLFLSHRSSDPSDKASADEIKRLLESLAEGFVDVFVSGTDIRAGQDWRNVLRPKLKNADCLVFLYTDRQANWSWCHFEAGLFLSSSSGPVDKDTAEKPIICLYPDTLDAVTSPLANYQTIAVPSQLDRLRQFLIDLFVEDDPVRRLWFDNHSDRLDSMAKAISDEVERMATDSIALCRSITLRGATKPETEEIPGTYIVETEQNALQEVFNLTGQRQDGKPWTWRDLSAHTEKQPWVAQLAAGMAKYIGTRELPSALSGYFRAPTGREYSPVLTRIDRSGVDYSFQVLFLERNEFGNTDPVSSFSDLMTRLVDLLHNMKPSDTVKWIAYTPALGFLAEPEARWNELRDAIKAKADQIEMICLDDTELSLWHGEFVGKKTARLNHTIDEALIKEADDASRDLLKALRDQGRQPKRKSFGGMPGFYLFKSTMRAIIVSPVGVPLLTDVDNPHPNKHLKTLLETKVEMFGLDTTVTSIIKNAEMAFARFNQS